MTAKFKNEQPEGEEAEDFRAAVQARLDAKMIEAYKLNRAALVAQEQARAINQEIFELEQTLAGLTRTTGSAEQGE